MDHVVMLMLLLGSLTTQRARYRLKCRADFETDSVKSQCLECSRLLLDPMQVRHFSILVDCHTCQHLFQHFQRLIMTNRSMKRKRKRRRRRMIMMMKMKKKMRTAKTYFLRFHHHHRVLAVRQCQSKRRKLNHHSLLHPS